MSSRAAVVAAFVFSSVLATASAATVNGVQPHIVVILADDLGYNDVGYNSWNNETFTDNITALASSGVIFDRFYAQPKCSPSRAALLTGLYPIHTGFNEGALGSSEKAGIESSYPTLAQNLNPLGYTSHMLGKWHVGWCKDDYLPLNKGFSSFTGVYHSGADHDDYSSGSSLGADTYELFNGTHTEDRQWDGVWSHEMYAAKADDIIMNHDVSTDGRLFLYVALQNIHSPREAPEDFYSIYRTTTDWVARRQTQGMIYAMDITVGSIRNSLEAAGLLDETVIVFASDNGGQANGGASNYPLRGGKDTFWEGGMRVPSFMYSRLFEEESFAGSVSECTFHITDWHATLLSWAGADLSTYSLDGMDQWDGIVNSTSCPRTTIIHNIVRNRKNQMTEGSILVGDYKLIYGAPSTNGLDGWYLTNSTDIASDYVDGDIWHLFDVINDPNEKENLADVETTIRDELYDLLDAETSGVVDFPLKGEKCADADMYEEVDGLGHWKFGCCA